MKPILLAGLLLTTACASYRAPVPQPARPEAPFRMNVATPQEVVFRDLVDLATVSNMLSVESIDPATDTMVLVVGGAEPAMIIDCGTYSPGLLGDDVDAGPFVDYRVRIAGGELVGRITTRATEDAARDDTVVTVAGDFVFTDYWNQWTFDSSRTDVQKTVTGSSRPGHDRSRTGPERGCRSTQVAERVVLDFLRHRAAFYRQQGSFDNPGVAEIPPPRSTSVTVLAGEWGELAGRAHACGVPINATDSFSERAYAAIDARDDRGWVRRKAAGLFRAGFEQQKDNTANCERALVLYHSAASSL